MCLAKIAMALIPTKCRGIQVQIQCTELLVSVDSVANNNPTCPIYL